MKKLSLPIKVVVLAHFACASPLSATFKNVTLKLKGLNNEFGAYSLSKRLKALEEVASTEVNVSKGTADLKATDGKRINFSNIDQALNDSSFELRKIHVTATGKIVKDGENYLFAVNSSPYKIYLTKEYKEQDLQAASENFFKKAKTKIGSFLYTAVGLGNGTESTLQAAVKKAYEERNECSEINCNISKMRDGLLLGLADNNVRFRNATPLTLPTQSQTNLAMAKNETKFVRGNVVVPPAAKRAVVARQRLAQGAAQKALNAQKLAQTRSAKTVQQATSRREA